MSINSRWQREPGFSTYHPTCMVSASPLFHRARHEHAPSHTQTKASCDRLPVLRFARRRRVAPSARALPALVLRSATTWPPALVPSAAFAPAACDRATRWTRGRSKAALASLLHRPLPARPRVQSACARELSRARSRARGGAWDGCKGGGSSRTVSDGFTLLEGGWQRRRRSQLRRLRRRRLRRSLRQSLRALRGQLGEVLLHMCPASFDQRSARQKGAAQDVVRRTMHAPAALRRLADDLA